MGMIQSHISMFVRGLPLAMKSDNESSVLSATHGDVSTMALSGWTSTWGYFVGTIDGHTHQEFESLRALCEIISKMISLETQQGIQRVPKVTAERLAEIVRPVSP